MRSLTALALLLLIAPACRKTNLNASDKQALIQKYITEPGGPEATPLRVSMCLKANAPPEKLCGELTAQLAAQLIQATNPNSYDCETALMAIRRWHVPSADRVAAKCHQ